MSSGGSPTSTSNNAPPAWAIPYYQQGLGMAMNVATKPYEAYGGQQVAGMTDDQIAAMGMTRNQATNQQLLGSGSQFAQGMFGGQGQYQAEQNPYLGQTTQVGSNAYAGSNPYLGQMIDQSSQDITRNYREAEVPGLMSQFNSGGAFGGTAMADGMARSQQNLAQQLSDTSNQYRFQDYTTQQQLAEQALNRSVQAQQTDLARNAGLADSASARGQQAWGDYQGRQMQALGMVPGMNEAGYYGGNQLYQMGMQGQLNNQAQLDSAFENWQGGQNWDMDRLGSLAQMLGTIQGGSTTSANPNYRSAGQNALTAAAIAASFFSSEDAKTDKQPMDPDRALGAIRSLPIDTWKYKGDDEQHVGTYSQDFYKSLGMEPQEEIKSIDMFGALGGAVQALDKQVNGNRAGKSNKRKQA